MSTWTHIEAKLTDGKPMRLFVAELESRIWATCLHDDIHPRNESEFLWSLGRGDWSYAREKKAAGVLGTAVQQVREYFSGKRRSFDVPLALRGTPFQNQVWLQLTKIPFGAVETYAGIAEAVGNPLACRAVGGANGKNHLSVFVPCHRVIAAGGKLGGYTGGLGLKQRLLTHERVLL